ncbi:MAG: SufD family Fe-S cluster assembly protein [Lachnospiraceae bacterium]|nr:SufD family Fe-S cluster assembly protein [Lachnospiraceae bacterium]
MIRMNKLPAGTFNHLRLNETEVDYEPGCPEIIEISDNAELEFDKEGDKQILINVPDNRNITVSMAYDFDGTLNARTDIEIGAGGSLRLIQANVSQTHGRLINRVAGKVGNSAGFETIQLFPDSGDIYSDLTVDLVGHESSADIRCAYFTGGQRHLDTNYVVNHFGRMSESRILASGALADKAYKTFRGTIDFKTGSSGSKGDEREKVILLDEDVVNRSIPLILCTEEDVEGAHGAAIGSLDEEIMFYIKSRGISPEEAKRLVIFGMFESLLMQAGNESLGNRVQKCLQKIRM